MCANLELTFTHISTREKELLIKIILLGTWKKITFNNINTYRVEIFFIHSFWAFGRGMRVCHRYFTVIVDIFKTESSPRRNG